MSNRALSVEHSTGKAAAFAAAERCWSWHLCPAGCATADDCLLTGPLPVHNHDRPCPGQFGAGGQWVPCCRGAA